MKDINLISLTQAANTLSEAYFTRYYQYYGIGIKPDEVEVLKNFVKKLGYECGDKRIFNHFFVGYKIPQISKEFDLLRIGDNYIINIELKRECTEEKIKKQLIQNRYYLKFLNEKVFNFTYVSSTNSLYLLTDEGLIFVEPLVLQHSLSKQNIRKVENINALFNPSNYLVSPFNSTDKFLAGQYFLTGQQSDIKQQVIARINAPSGNNFTAVIGGAGTGKSLLTYDIADYFMSTGKRVILFHCYNLNSGHYDLNRNNWNITSIKNIEAIDANDYDLIFIDEAQRMARHYFYYLVHKINNSTCKCIFSLDEMQTLSLWERIDKVSEKILKLKGVEKFELTNKIRTNKNVTSFIRGFINNKQNEPVLNYDNVNFEYYTSIDDVKLHLQYLWKLGWTVLQFSPDFYRHDSHAKYLESRSLLSHQIIGQEFDNVAVIVDEYFNYKDNGELSYSGITEYDADKMLFQNMTRTRNQLKILILNNPTILERCLTLLNPPKSQ